MRQRKFRDDSQFCISTLHPPLRVTGTENIPQQGPCLIVLNHYYRPGFRPWWLAMGISATLPVNAHWVMTSEWTAPGKLYEPVKSSLSRFAANRIARVYGFTTMPPMPPRPKDVEARAQAVRSVLSYVGRTEKPVICLAPEGADIPGGKLTWPPSGAGRFMLLLAGKGLPFIPVGGWEDDDGALCIRFGPAFDLDLPSGLTVREKDLCTAQIVMQRLAALLPLHLRGDFV